MNGQGPGRPVRAARVVPAAGDGSIRRWTPGAEKLPYSELYQRTGIQLQPFNTVYQLYADKLAGRLNGVTDSLMLPEYLMYKLCGAKSHEYTNATTGGMVSAATGEFDMEIIEALGLPEHLFVKLSQRAR